MSDHTGGPDCPACAEMFAIEEDDEEDDVSFALGVLEDAISSDMLAKESVRHRLIALLGQLEGIVPRTEVVRLDDEPEPATVRPGGGSMAN